MPDTCQTVQSNALEYLSTLINRCLDKWSVTTFRVEDSTWFGGGGCLSLGLSGHQWLGRVLTIVVFGWLSFGERQQGLSWEQLNVASLYGIKSFMSQILSAGGSFCRVFWWVRVDSRQESHTPAIRVSFMHTSAFCLCVARCQPHINKAQQQSKEVEDLLTSMTSIECGQRSTCGTLRTSRMGGSTTAPPRARHHHFWGTYLDFRLPKTLTSERNDSGTVIRPC